MLMSTLRAMITNPFWKNFDIIFMRNEKKIVKTLIITFFSHKQYYTT